MHTETIKRERKYIDLITNERSTLASKPTKI